ncbi:MAG: hydrogenase nickel incorporation protein HypB [bacterium]|nr:hydrogenase nickel incorporation protein HypB [bacterium]
MKKINVVTSVLKANDAVASGNRERMEGAGMLVLNITSAPGSGKTALLERTIPALAPEMKSAVIVGDLQTTRDAERLGDLAVEVTQINTEGGCHLSATQVSDALDGLELKDLSVMFIENVGNMVCPSGFDLGEHVRVAMLSVPEGADKVAKYPTLFQPADVILLNKMDLAEVLEYDTSIVREDLSRINTRAPLFEISAKTGEGMDQWLDWIRNRYQHQGK